MTEKTCCGNSDEAHPASAETRLAAAVQTRWHSRRGRVRAVARLACRRPTTRMGRRPTWSAPCRRRRAPCRESRRSWNVPTAWGRGACAGVSPAATTACGRACTRSGRRTPRLRYWSPPTTSSPSMRCASPWAGSTCGCWSSTRTASTSGAPPARAPSRPTRSRGWSDETRLAEVVEHRRLILPQLSAPGVAAHRVKRACGFRVIFGPVRAADLPRFLAADLKADAAMRTVTFDLRERLVVAPVEIHCAPGPSYAGRLRRHHRGSEYRPRRHLARPAACGAVCPLSALPALPCSPEADSHRHCCRGSPGAPSRSRALPSEPRPRASRHLLSAGVCRLPPSSRCLPACRLPPPMRP